ncbi:MAG TPA: hypothetical protein ENH01_12990 [Nitrospirae bacterium]|nr:hypothetical protein [Nitrospirota bacterium]
MLKKISTNIAVFILSLLFCLFLLEIILRTGLFDGADDPQPIWIPLEFQKIDKEINRENWQFAKLNPFRFTDKIRKEKKEDGITRIAVLGDSFIWGYGLPYKQAWSHKLENMITGKYENFEVMSWGQGAWSTMDELSFLEKNGINYDIDMLIVGFVDNDPNMKDIKNKTYGWSSNLVIRSLRIFFPNATNFIVTHTNYFLTQYFYKDHQYHNWIRRLYSDDNLQNYLELLQDFSVFCNSNNIKLLFVLTPHSHDEGMRKRFDRIKPLLEQANIKYLDLFPVVKEKLGHIPVRKLWANPANGHPGSLLTGVYADSTFDYLEKQGVFSQEDTLVKILEEKTERNINDAEAVQSLVNIALQDVQWDVRKEAAVALGKVNSPLAVAPLIAAAEHFDPGIREAAVDALGELKDPRVLTYLVRALEDKSVPVRKRAVIALGRKGDLRYVAPLITTAIKDNDPYVRRRALVALSKMKDPRIVQCFILALEDPFYHNRKSAVISLGKTKAPEAVDPLIALLNDEDRDIRVEAAYALGEINEPRIVEVLKIVSLKDKDTYVRDIAADGIKKITGKEYGKYRRKLLRIWQMF